MDAVLKLDAFCQVFCKVADHLVQCLCPDTEYPENQVFCLIKNNFVYVIGRRCSGKTTLIKKIVQKYVQKYHGKKAITALDPLHPEIPVAVHVAVFTRNSFEDFKDITSEHYIHHRPCSVDFLKKIKDTFGTLQKYAQNQQKKCIVVNDCPSKNDLLECIPSEFIIVVQSVLLGDAKDEFKTLEDAVDFLMMLPPPSTT